MDTLDISTTWYVFFNLQTQAFLHLGGNFSSSNLWMIFLFHVLDSIPKNCIDLSFFCYLCHSYIFSSIVLVSFFFLCISWDYPPIFLVSNLIFSWVSLRLVFLVLQSTFPSHSPCLLELTCLWSYCIDLSAHGELFSFMVMFLGELGSSPILPAVLLPFIPFLSNNFAWLAQHRFSSCLCST